MERTGELGRWNPHQPTPPFNSNPGNLSLLFVWNLILILLVKRFISHKLLALNLVLLTYVPTMNHVKHTGRYITFGKSHQRSCGDANNISTSEVGNWFWRQNVSERATSRERQIFGSMVRTYYNIIYSCGCVSTVIIIKRYIVHQYYYIRKSLMRRQERWRPNVSDVSLSLLIFTFSTNLIISLWVSFGIVGCSCPAILKILLSLPFVVVLLILATLHTKEWIRRNKRLRGFPYRKFIAEYNYICRCSCRASGFSHLERYMDKLFRCNDQVSV